VSRVESGGREGRCAFTVRKLAGDPSDLPFLRTACSGIGPPCVEGGMARPPPHPRFQVPGCLYFIHHVASSIQADGVVHSIPRETEDAI
jgi:hypothetical protein